MTTHQHRGFAAQMGHISRRLTLLVSALLAVIPAVRHPVASDTVVDATQFSTALFATLLTGEAVVFALTFSAASSWPSLRSIDDHIAFREWVFVGSLATLFTACGLLAGADTSATYGAVLFLLADLFGIFSFIRLFELASIGGRNRLLRRTLAQGLHDATPADLSHAHDLGDDPVIAMYLSAVDQAISSRDPHSVRHVVGQLTDVAVKGDAEATGVALHLEVLHRLTRASLVSGMDPIVAADCARSLVESVVHRARTTPGTAAALGAASRQLAWLSSTALVVAARDTSALRPARELIAMAVEGRLSILRAVDPDPVSASGDHERGSVLKTPVEVALWVRDFTEFQGSDQAAAFYGVYEQLTGTKFMGNYWDGDSILGRLREALYGTDSPADTPRAEAARAFFGPVAEFDRFWALASVTALSTLRDARLPHPPQLIRPEFTPDTQLLGAYLRTFATHRWFTTADEARQALLSLMIRTETPNSAWQQLRSLSQRHRFHTPAPVVVPRERPAAMVLAVAGRLAPLSPEDPDADLRSFLAGLPHTTLDAAGALAARVLPTSLPHQNPSDIIVDGFKVMQTVGTHVRVVS